jgi:hypothetical protein
VLNVKWRKKIRVYPYIFLQSFLINHFSRQGVK